jgi:two-component system, OmpR family, phosphate regulon sensor histidine kinase PhoR
MKAVPVILTVALPSLLLTGLAAVAVENEEAASRMRIERVYDPVLLDVAKRFNTRMDELLAESRFPLQELVRHGAGDPADTAVIDAFVKKTGDAGINYFVIDPSGEILLPRTPSGEKIDRKEHRSGCEQWSRANETCEEERCPLEMARTICSIAGGSTDALQFSDECIDYSRQPMSKVALHAAAIEGEQRADAAREMGRAKELRRSNPVSGRTIDSAFEVARRSKNPLELQLPLVSKVTTDELLARLGNDHRGSREANCARAQIRALATRGALLGHLATFGHPREMAAQVHTVETDGWRRVIVAGSFNGYLAGFELAACSLEQMLDQPIAERQLDDAVHAQLWPVQIPKEWVSHDEWKDHENRVAAWTLLKKTNLAWKLALMLEDQSGVLSMTRSRSTLYLWALVLIAGALLAGIGYTIRTFAEEARLARLKTDFVSSVSHDLRTPLTSIRMFTETLLLGRASSKDEEREFLQVIADETDRLSRLTERILDFSRMEAGRKAYQFSPAEIPDLVSQALRACRPMIEEAEFEVSTAYPDELPSIEVDRDAMVEVLINLISNAIKYSPDERAIGISAFVEGPRVAISVKDRGIGIPKAEHAKIFEKFYRVDSRRACEVGGTGLGLSLVHHIVTAHGGQVTVESAPGAGSNFTVWLEVGTWRASSS